MLKGIKLAPKKRGRPSTGGRDPGVHIRLPKELIGAVDDWGVAKKTKSRSEAIRLLVEIGLRTRGK